MAPREIKTHRDLNTLQCVFFIQACEIADASLISEVDFVPKYQMLLENLALSKTAKPPSAEVVELSSEPSIKGLGRLISESPHRHAGDLIRSFFQATSLPSLTSLSTYSSSSVEKFSTLFDPTMLSSMVSFDVAVVSEVETDVSLDLLCSSRSGLVDVVTVRTSQTGLGICRFADHLVAVIGRSRSLSAETSVAKLLSLITFPVNAEWVNAYRVLLDSVAKIMKQTSKLNCWQYSIKSGYCLEVLLLDAVKMSETYLPRGGLVPLLIEYVLHYCFFLIFLFLLSEFCVIGFVFYTRFSVFWWFQMG